MRGEKEIKPLYVHCHSHYMYDIHSHYDQHIYMNNSTRKKGKERTKHLQLYRLRKYTLSHDSLNIQPQWLREKYSHNLTTTFTPSFITFNPSLPPLLPSSSAVTSLSEKLSSTSSQLSAKPEGGGGVVRVGVGAKKEEDALPSPGRTCKVCWSSCREGRRGRGGGREGGKEDIQTLIHVSMLNSPEVILHVKLFHVI